MTLPITRVRLRPGTRLAALLKDWTTQERVPAGQPGGGEWGSGGGSSGDAKPQTPAQQIAANHQAAVRRAGASLRAALAARDRAVDRARLLADFKPGKAVLATTVTKDWTTQARDELGRWGEGGGGAGGSGGGGSVAAGGDNYAGLFSDNLGIARGDMPQIPNGAMKDKFLAEQQAAGITHTRETVMASSLKATQATFKQENIDYLRGQAAGKYTGNPILVSSDNRVLDGHHRWAGAVVEGKTIDVIRVDQPIRSLVAAARDFSVRNAIPARKFWTHLGGLVKGWETQPRVPAGGPGGGQWGDGNGGAGSTAPTDAAHYGMGAPASVSAPSANPMSALNAEHLSRLGPLAAVQLQDVYRAAADAKPGFDKSLTAVAEAVGGKAKLPALKGSDRATLKIVSDYKGDASQIKDVLRATVVVNAPGESQAALAGIREKFDVLPTGFRNTLDPKADPVDGYRDIKMNVKVNGITAEVQVNVPAMLAVKATMHGEYAQREAITRTISDAGRKATPAEKAQIDSLNATMKAAYAPVWAKLMAGGG